MATLVRAAAAALLLAPALAGGQAVTVGAGAAAVGVSRAGRGPYVAATYDAPLRGRARWWAGAAAAYDRDPGVASPGTRQSVTEAVLAAGPLTEVAGPGPTALLLGAGAYGAVNRYGAPDPPQQDRRGAYWGGGDWGVVGRVALQAGDPRRLVVLVDGALRYSFDPSPRRVLPGVALGVRRRWR